ncbi:hypothetical protein FB567DRAFT_521303 [Paraphoma chrysanthemicola]|uniref:DUF1446-domain-containing protein n=1 Tax=Paraphoma chrysanthemicola TaxID=798071 RepID=A0A8K0R7V0_9PLEO|nr:hypothetical protein FB567DRAFT_521303 [Paraphoma chrysanthemicola]
MPLVSRLNMSINGQASTRASRPLRVCGVSGSTLDLRHGFIAAAQANEQIDLLIGDWMSEGNMPSAALRKLGSADEPGYEKSFLTSIKPALKLIVEKGIKVAVNAGAADPEALVTELQNLSLAQGLQLNLAWISGDDVSDQATSSTTGGKGAGLINIANGAPLESLPFQPIFAQAYLGSFGVAKAFEQGADIVICGRVADASLLIGGAIWWFDWKPDQHDQLARALIAGHLSECSTYVTGGNFTGFKSVPRKEDLGFPIVEIASDGDVVITKLEGTGGIVSKQTVTAQLLYEIQGPWYFNSDVTATLTDIFLEQCGDDRVRVHGVVGSPPPPTTKVGLVSKPKYQAELHWSLVGLDIEEKAALLEANIRASLGEEFLSQVSCITFTTHGSAAENPTSQNSATVDFRIFVQAPEKELLSYSKWIEPTLNVIMCSYPGATMQPALTAGLPRPYCEYVVALIDQTEINHRVHLKKDVFEIPAPTTTLTYPAQQPSHNPKDALDLSAFGETIRGSLGKIVHARSGDKGSNANVGFFARNENEYQWLRALLTTEKIKQLLADEYHEGNRIDRFELPGLLAVHFLLHDHLDRGINSTSTYDILGKNVGEFLRARHVDLPKNFLLAGEI